MHLRRKWQPTPAFLPGESQGQRSLVSCRLLGLIELDVTEAMQQQCVYWRIPDGPAGKEFTCKESACNARDTGDSVSIPGLGRSLGEGNGNSLQYNWPKSSRSREACKARVQRVPKSLTQLSDWAGRQCVYAIPNSRFISPPTTTCP